MKTTLFYSVILLIICYSMPVGVATPVINPAEFKKTPEKLLIKVLDSAVEKSDEINPKYTTIKMKVEVLKVLKTSSGLRPGEIIHIHYVQDHESTERQRKKMEAEVAKGQGWAGPQVMYNPDPPEVGDSCIAYLRKASGDGPNERVYAPGAYQESFEKIMPNRREGKPQTQPDGNTARFIVVDAYSGGKIKNTRVRIYSDNGIRCIMPPCPTDSRTWFGITDNEGRLEVPLEILNVETIITVPGYESGRDLQEDSEKLSDNARIIELDPDRKVNSFQRRLKIIDAQTRKSLANVPVWVTTTKNCIPPECPKYIFKSKTNALGNIFFPLHSVDPGNWIVVKGYKPSRIPSGWRNYKVSLEKN